MPSRPWRPGASPSRICGRSRRSSPTARRCLLGLEAVENALVTHREARRRFDKLREAKGVERRAVALAHDRYRSGLVDFLDGLETERTLYAAQTELARGERAVSQDLVRLYKALGGGWGHDTARAQVTPSPWPISSKE